MAAARHVPGAGPPTPPARVCSCCLSIAGYLLTWATVGLLLHSGDRLVHPAGRAIAWLGEQPGLIAAGTVLVAGIYQFTPLKYRCLDECRSPLGFL